MLDPVVAQDGYTYQRAPLEMWIAKCQQGQPVSQPYHSLLCTYVCVYIATPFSPPVPTPPARSIQQRAGIRAAP